MKMFIYSTAWHITLLNFHGPFLFISIFKCPSSVCCCFWALITDQQGHIGAVNLFAVGFEMNLENSLLVILILDCWMRIIHILSYVILCIFSTIILSQSVCAEVLLCRTVEVLLKMFNCQIIRITLSIKFKNETSFLEETLH